MYNYELKFKEVPPSVYAGFFNRTPFYIGLTTNNPDYEDLRINFFSQNSNSAPYQQPQNKWSHLVPQWGFFNSNAEYIEFANPYCVQEKLIGGEIFYETCVSAYYIDNTPSNVTIIATLETSGLPLSSDNYEIDLPSYSNSLIYDEVEYEVLSNTFNNLKITQDGKNSIDVFKWTKTNIPFVITLHPESSSQSINTNIYGLTSFDPILFNLPQGNNTINLQLSVQNLNFENVKWNQSDSIYISSLDELSFNSGGFYKGYFISEQSISSTKILAYYGSSIGESNEFQIKDFERPYELRRFNESWDTAATMKSFALAEHTFENPIFFDNFLEVSVGGLNPNYQSLGRRFYERIANFVKNNSDIDVCNLNQLYSLHDEIDTPIDDYRLSYPSEIRRLVDIMSLKKEKILGGFCKCNRNFFSKANKCYFCGHFHSLNRAEQAMSPNTYVISANVPFVIENIYTKKQAYQYDLLYPISQDMNGLQTGVMSSFSNISWLTSANYLKYNVYDFIPDYCETQLEGVVNWSDSFTTLLSAVSTYNDLYKNNGVLEEVFNFEIHRGLYDV
jgi:hypothetical protein